MSSDDKTEVDHEKVDPTALFDAWDARQRGLPVAPPSPPRIPVEPSESSVLFQDAGQWPLSEPEPDPPKIAERDVEANREHVREQAAAALVAPARLAQRGVSAVDWGRVGTAISLPVQASGIVWVLFQMDGAANWPLGLLPTSVSGYVFLRSLYYARTGR